MRQSGALLLAGALASSSVVVAASPPRGVGPEFAQYYEAKTRFACIHHPDIVLDAAQVNDGSCDCPDGSDEPGTAACAFIDRLSPPQPLPGSPSGTTNHTPALPGFWCANKGHVGAYVPFAYVDDGVCDYDVCCDGSDERLGKGGVKCPSQCAAIGKEARRAADAVRQRQERALVQRRALVKEARRLRNELQARVNAQRVELVELEKTQTRVAAELAETERAERGKVVAQEGNGGGKLGVLVGLARRRVDELRATLEKLVDHRDDLRDKVAELEGILGALKEQYNPNFNDEGVKTAVHAWEDYAAKSAVDAGRKSYAMADADVHAVLAPDSDTVGVNWAEFERDDSETDIIYSFQAYVPPFMHAFLNDKIAAARAWLVNSGVLADNSDPDRETAVLAAARKALRDADTALDKSRKDLASSEEDLAKDYGAQDVLRALKDKCVKADVAEYTYEFCWLGQAFQRSKAGGSTTLGRFDRFDTLVADDEPRADGRSLGKGPRTVLRYENGQHCWNGPNRRVDVWLGCSETEEIWRVSETQKCEYKFEIGTPIACEEPVDEGKDEL